MKKKIYQIILALFFITVTVSMVIYIRESNHDNKDKDNSDMSMTVNEISAYDEEKADYLLTVDTNEEIHQISNTLFGVFLEDINRTIDGGMYAELIKNNSFEYTDEIKNYETDHAWERMGEVKTTVIQNDKEGGLNINNCSYMIIENTDNKFAGVENTGYSKEMSVEAEKEYTVGLYIKGYGYDKEVKVEIVKDNVSIAEYTIEAVSDKWEKYEFTLKPSVSADKDVRLRISMLDGKMAIDMVSLMPSDNIYGMRSDLYNAIKDMTPGFVRFPGGCLVEGVRLDDAYSWKASIGCDEKGEPLLFNGTYGNVAARKQGKNKVWGYFMTYGVGFYEYFLMCEDIGALPVPVVNTGMSCQVHENNEIANGEELWQYIQDALDLVEFCRGNENTKWGAVRIAMGHTEPFNIKYLGIGNENTGDEAVFNYRKFLEAFDEAAEKNPEMYGDIELITCTTWDTREIKEWFTENGSDNADDYAGAIDHHYYLSKDWFLSHNDYYDSENYSRDVENMLEKRHGGGLKVMVGEYACKTEDDTSNSLENALAEASFMTGLERNGDIVIMAAYAPLFAKVGNISWKPDLIYFDNNSVNLTANYYVQKLFANNTGDTLIKSALSGENIVAEEDILRGRIGIGTWNTKASFDNIVITDNKTGKVLGEDSFEEEMLSNKWQLVSDGEWSVKNGALYQNSLNTDTDRYKVGSAAYFGNTEWKNYTFECDATKLDGAEGFLITFAANDTDNNFFWNIGGWGNTYSAVQRLENGSKSVGSAKSDFIVEENKTYHIKIVVNENSVKGYIDGKQYLEYKLSGTKSNVYQVVSKDKKGDVIIKLVNITDEQKTFAINTGESEKTELNILVSEVSGEEKSAENGINEDEKVKYKEYELTAESEKFAYTVPKYSTTVLRIKGK